MTGKVKTLTEKGYGFITVEGAKKDMFFHARQLRNVNYEDLKVGDTLEFDTEQGEKGLNAINIELLDNE